MAQEDLWVYETLLRLVRKVNEGATSQANAPIKKIVALDIGKDSAAAWDAGPQSGIQRWQAGLRRRRRIPAPEAARF